MGDVGVRFLTDRDEWWGWTSIRDVVTFEGIAPKADWVADLYEGVREIRGVSFSTRRCLAVVDREYHETRSYEWGAPAVLEASTAHREHAIGPGGPLRATLPPEVNAVGLFTFTIVPFAQPVLVRARSGGREFEFVRETYERPTLAFVGAWSEGPLEWIELDLAPGAVNDYVFIAALEYGRREEAAGV